jgi:hypothetical protein
VRLEGQHHHISAGERFFQIRCESDAGALRERSCRRAAASDTANVLGLAHGLSKQAIHDGRGHSSSTDE